MQGTAIDWYKYADMLASDMLNRDIAEVIGCTAGAVRYQRRKMYGERPHEGRKYDWKQWDHVVRDESLSIAEAAKVVGCSYGSMEFQRKRRGLTERPLGCRDIRRFNYKRWLEDKLAGCEKPVNEYHERMFTDEQMIEIARREDEEEENESIGCL